MTIIYDVNIASTTAAVVAAAAVSASGTKETAFVHAVTSAGVVHAVTLACSSGNLTDCSCDMNPGGGGGGGGQAPAGHVPGVPGGFGDDGWRWGGCSDNVNYGVWFTMMFVDAAERMKIGPQTQFSVIRNRRTVSDEIKALVNLHNNEVGRKVSRL